jgi:mono/diheme cytochrome c family protein
VPFFQVKVAAPAALTAAATAYKAVVGGTAPASTLPDIRDIFSPEAERGASLRPAAGATGLGVMSQMCQRCHNSNLDQTISRARFNAATLAAMGRAEKDIAISRLQLPAENLLRMPPARFGTLTDAEIQLVVDELKK